MFLSYEEMKKFEIAYKNGEGPKHTLSDVHVNPDTGEIVSYVYADEVHETREGDTNYSDRSLDMVKSMGGSGSSGNIGNIPQAEGLPRTNTSNVQYYFIKAENVSIEGDKIYYKGAIKEGDYVIEDAVSLEGILNDEIVTEEGKEVGKIKDVYLNIDLNRLEGLKLSEGFWQKLKGDGTKYLPVSAIVKWAPEPVICKDPIEEYLADEIEEMK